MFGISRPVGLVYNFKVNPPTGVEDPHLLMFLRLKVAECFE